MTPRNAQLTLARLRHHARDLAQAMDLARIQHPELTQFLATFDAHGIWYAIDDELQRRERAISQGGSPCT